MALVLAVLWIALRHDVGFYRVTSGSMAPTLAPGQRVAVDASLVPRIGEIVVFRSPEGALAPSAQCGAQGEGAGTPSVCGQPAGGASSTIFLKRIVAGPGDSVAMVGGRLLVNGHAPPDPHGSRCQSTFLCNFRVPVRIPSGDYFMLGDNRAASDDSRFWGPVPRSWIVAVVVHCGALRLSCSPL